MDRTDDIRSELRHARDKGNAAKLRHAYDLLARDEAAPLARAIVGDVLRDLEPPVAAAPSGKTCVMCGPGKPDEHFTPDGRCVGSGC